ncbi:hypothetical protein [Paenibacillus thalictri]|uniref:Uncharacterized protein n=1 Tax=Paenibacillus thalictri TaxID=2527873 RepID=A0A4Q9DE73_9BACL|nr:hypothetical protein [Paenibacillus thalictri]TBL69784.1 hypothetical protein EYB31_34995 [Paenibacillus thalictri]
MVTTIDVSAFIYNLHGKPSFEVVKQWFTFQRKVLFDLYGNFFDDKDRFRIYLYLCKFYSVKDNLSMLSKQKINVDLGYATLAANSTKLNNYSPIVDAVLDSLEAEHFIQRRGISIRSSFRCSLLTAPDYNPQTQKFTSNADIPCNHANLKGINHGFIMVPTKAVTKERLRNTPGTRQTWNDRRLKFLLMLYAHCHIEYFGGIDKRIVSINPAGKMSLDEGFCYNLNVSPSAALTTMEWLLRKGEFVPVRCYFLRGVYYGDVGKCKPNPDLKEHIILRPKYLIKHTFDSLEMKKIKGRMFI